jgi:hypothetical protein
VDGLGRVIFLTVATFSGKQICLLGAGTARSTRLWDRRNERTAPARGADDVGGLTVRTELPVPRGQLIARVEDRRFENC